MDYREAADSGKRIRVGDLPFRPFLSADSIQARVGELGAALRGRLGAGRPTYLIMLKGAFMFAADLIRATELGGEISFVRTKSYSGTSSDGRVQLLLAPEPALIKDRDVVLIEDIVDSGLTMQAFLPELQRLEPASVTLVTLLHKPEAQRVPVDIALTGFSIPNKFVVGYGLDYNGQGRELPAIYQLAQDY